MVLGLIMSLPTFGAGTLYEIRADGLACPYCAYGIEKRLKQINGVESVDVDLKHGIVAVRCTEGVELSETQLKKLFRDAGFTYRSMQATEL